MNGLIRLLVATGVASSLAVAVAWACGPFITALQTVAAVQPAHEPEFVRGEIGIVRPQLRRVNLVMAYRALAGQPPLPPETQPTGGIDPFDEWSKRRDTVLGPPVQRQDRTRLMVDYSTIENCLADAYRTAAKTFDDRASRLGERSVEFRDWVRAQDTVFANCDEAPMLVPDPVPAAAPALVRADREYQIAAAHFYGMQYEEAAQRFSAIGNDPASPWRPYGRYLAARATIRAASMADGDYAGAEKQLLAVIADPVAAPVHESARGLLTRIRLRLRPGDELIRISNQLATSRDAVAASELGNFRYLMDHIIGDRVVFPYEEVDPEAPGVAGNDLAEWMIAFQGTGDDATERAVSRWQATRTTPWLVAALWHVAGKHPAAEALLKASATVPPTSPSYATVSFYRVRLLIALDRQDEARSVLADLPEEARPGFPLETINLFRAQRMLLARGLDEFLRYAPRIGAVGSQPAYTPSPEATIGFDDDAAVVLDQWLPLEMLINAASSPALPARLRTRVAVAAFTRAIVLDRHDTARRIAPVLRNLAPAIAADLDHYLGQGTPAAMRDAAVLLLVRTPGMTTKISGLDSNYSIELAEPRRRHADYFSSWWCGRYGESSALIPILYRDGEISTPSWVTAADRETARQEHSDLAASGSPARFLANGVLDFVRQHPEDPAAPEALSRVVNGWRRTCRGEADAMLARRAFQELHRRYPQSDFAKQTKYWYR